MSRWLGRATKAVVARRRSWYAVGVISLVSLVPAPALHAHAILLESVPPAEASVPAPPRLVLKFNSRIEARLSSVLLVGGPRNTRVLLSMPQGSTLNTLDYLLPVLPPGQYRAEWKAMSVDGHLTDGVLRFTVIEVPR